MKMDFKHALLAFLLLSFARSSSSKCPEKCSCYLDAKGRNTVECKEGGMIGPLSLQDVQPSTEVLKITAPEDNANVLTMSPTLQSYRKLEEVHITRSNIPILGMHFFFGLDKLDILNLSQNNITQPLDHNFRGLIHLKELYLDDNRIMSLPSSTFRYLTDLKVLSLQRNRLHELMPRTFQELRKLRVLKLNGNNLKVLSAEVFEDIRELRTLECRGCSLTTATKDVYKVVPYLTHLDLGYNEIASLENDDFKDLTNLRHLKLDNNELTDISEEVFLHQTELKKLSLAKNSIKEIPPQAFRNLNNLTELDLSYNNLENLSEELFETIGSTLQKVVLSGNIIRMRDIENALAKCTALRELYLANMNLATVSINLVPRTVIGLHVGGNYISYLPIDSLPTNLIELDLSDNKFRGMDEETVHRIERIPKLKLDNNPWGCDLCHIVPLLDRVNKSVVFFNVKCLGPYTVEGMVLGNLQREKLSWCAGPSYTAGEPNYFLTGEEGKIGVIAAGASALLLVLVIVIILAAFLYSRRHAAKYYTHEEKRVPESEAIFETNSPLFGEERELSFKFPLDPPDKKIAIATIDEIKKEHAISNGS